MPSDNDNNSSSTSELPTRSAPPGADGDPGHSEDSAGDGEPSESKSVSGDPGVDDFLDNTKKMLQRSGEVLPFVWVAIVLLVSTPTLVRIAMGFDPFQPFAFEMGTGVVLLEFGCHAAAVALFTLSLPVARAYLIADDGGPQTFAAAFSIVGDHLDDAVLIAAIYYVCVMVGLMTCILPGLFAAVYLAPALYLAAARGESTLAALIKGSSQLGRYSNLYAVIVVGLFAVFLAVSFALSIGLAGAGSTDEFATLAAQPLSMLLFSIGYIVVTAVLYFVYIAAVSLFVTIETAETSAVVAQ